MNKQTLITVSASLIMLIIGLCSCSPEPHALEKKRILQQIDMDASGMIQIDKVYEFESIGNDQFRIRYSFFNPLVSKDVRITREYTMSPDGEKILDDKDIKTEMKSQGEWIEPKFFDDDQN